MAKINKPYARRNVLRQPVINLLESIKGQQDTAENVVKVLGRRLGATPEFLKLKHANGDNVFYKDVAWTIDGLKRDGLIDSNADRGIWRLVQTAPPPVHSELSLEFESNPSTEFRQGDKIEDDREQNELCDIYGDLSKEKIATELKKTLKQTGEKVEVKYKTYKRDNKAIALIKAYRGMTCQICTTTIVKKNKKKYIEAAHITAKKREGPEVPENILVLCPNHHKEFDYGDLEILEQNNKMIRFTLNNVPHTISLEIE